MEYIMTYGWAVLVVIIVGVVMWQMGIFGLDTDSPEYKEWEQECIDFCGNKSRYDPRLFYSTNRYDNSCTCIRKKCMEQDHWVSEQSYNREFEILCLDTYIKLEKWQK